MGVDLRANEKAKVMAETLVEYTFLRNESGRIDADAGWIRGVKVLGVRSRNGRRYSAEALRGAAGLYEGVKVNVNHPRGSTEGTRDYRDRIGTIRGVRFVEGEGLFADLHFNPKHPLAGQLTWDAENAPEHAGFSHYVEATTRRERGEIIVEKIDRVHSVDLVADPATTSGMFESERDLAEEGEADETEQLREELTKLRRREAERSRLEAAERLLREAGLPSLNDESREAALLVDETFREELAAATDLEATRTAVRRRVSLLEAGERWLGRRRAGRRCTAAEQRTFREGPEEDVERFVESVAVR